MNIEKKYQMLARIVFMMLEQKHLENENMELYYIQEATELICGDEYLIHIDKIELRRFVTKIEKTYGRGYSG